MTDAMTTDAMTTTELAQRVALLEARSGGDLMNIETACAFLNVSAPTFWRWRRNGVVRRDGSRIYLRPDGGHTRSPRFSRATLIDFRKSIHQ